MDLRRRLGGTARLPALLARQDQQFGMDGQQFGGNLFELTPGLDAGTNGIEPVGRNGFDSFFAGGHESESGERMTVAFRAVASGFSAAAMGNSERAWKSIVGQMETGQKKAGTAAEAGSLWPTCGRNVIAHLIVIIQSEKSKNNPFIKCFFR